MPEATGLVPYVFLEGYCGREEASQDLTVFMRIDEHSMPGRVLEARDHFQRRYEAGEPFPGEGLWAGGLPVRIAALRWDEQRHVLRLKIERTDQSPKPTGTRCASSRT